MLIKRDIINNQVTSPIHGPLIFYGHKLNGLEETIIVDKRQNLWKHIYIEYDLATKCELLNNTKMQ